MIIGVYKTRLRDKIGLMQRIQLAGLTVMTLLLAACTLKWDIPKVPRYNQRTGQCEEGYVYLPPHNVKSGSKVVDCSRRHSDADDDGVRLGERDVRKERSGMGREHQVRRDVGSPTPGEEGE